MVRLARASLSILLVSLAADVALAQSKASKRGPDKVVAVLSQMASTLTTTKYQHVTRVRADRGEYLFDCSGMAAWVLRRSAPGAIRSLGRPQGRRPLAVDFYRKIARIPQGKRRGPWYRVPDLTQAAPGDVITWKRPPWFPSKSTGHVAFVLSKGVVNSGPVPGYLFRIADATRFPHEADTRAQGETGFGSGVLLLASDGAAQPTGYGWYGSQSLPEWIVPAEIAVGRPIR